jgi:hypothetical protein
MKRIANRSGSTAGWRRLRSPQGQAIVETAAMMPLIIGLFVFLIMMMMFVGFTLYYHQKLAFVANEAAKYAADRLNGDGGDQDLAVLSGLQDNVDALTDSVGLPKVKTSVSPMPPTETVAVKLTMSGINLFNGQVPTVPIVEIGSALIDKTKPKGWVWMTFWDNQWNGGPVAAVPAYWVGQANASGKVFIKSGLQSGKPGLPELGNMVTSGTGSTILYGPTGDTIWSNFKGARIGW